MLRLDKTQKKHLGDFPPTLPDLPPPPHIAHATTTNTMYIINVVVKTSVVHQLQIRPREN